MGEDFTLSIYSTVESTEALAKDPLYRRLLVKQAKAVGCEKIYLESFRGRLIDAELLAEAKKAMAGEGFEVAGGVCIGVWGRGFGKRSVRLTGEEGTWVCLSDRSTLKALERIMETTAKVFDEILVDDLWVKWCYCDDCMSRFSKYLGSRISRKEFNKRLLDGDTYLEDAWERHSCQVLAEISEKHVVKPAKRVNQGLTLNLKLPEWYERYHHKGLDPIMLAGVFDGLYVGTESREGTWVYGSFFVARLVEAETGKLKGVWFDTLNGFSGLAIEVDRFIDQAYMSALTGVDELVIWCAPHVLEETRSLHMDKFKTERPFLADAWLTARGQRPLGIPIAKPRAPHAVNSAENYLADLLGCIGVPLTPIAARDAAKADAALVTEHSANMLDYPKLIEKGFKAVFTSGAVKRIVSWRPGDEWLDMLGLDRDRPIAAATAHVRSFTNIRDELNWVSREGHRLPGEAPLAPLLNVKECEPILYAYWGGSLWPVVYRRRYGDGTAYVALVTSSPQHLFLGYPEVVREALRLAVFEAAGLGLFKTRSPREWFTYRHYGGLQNIVFIPLRDSIILRNLNRFPVSLWLAISETVYGDRPLEIDAENEDGVYKVRLALAPRETRILRL